MTDITEDVARALAASRGLLAQSLTHMMCEDTSTLIEAAILILEGAELNLVVMVDQEIERLTSLDEALSEELNALIPDTDHEPSFDLAEFDMEWDTDASVGARDDRGGNEYRTALSAAIERFYLGVVAE